MTTVGGGTSSAEEPCPLTGIRYSCRRSESLKSCCVDRSCTWDYSPNLHRELLSEDELRAQLREKEVVDYDQVKLATLEGDGRLSVIKATP